MRLNLLVPLILALITGCAPTHDDVVGGLYCAEGAEGRQLEADYARSVSPSVGFEILEILGPDEIKAWAGQDVTQEQFDAVELSDGWFRNQPREVDMDSGTFARSPDGEMDGDFDEAELFGLPWIHVATITEANTPLDADGLLRRNTIRKFHSIGFDADRTMTVLVSPDDEAYVRITRDAGRVSDDPTLPAGWRLLICHTASAVEFDLPNPTLNIRADNEDSFQGPVDEVALAL